MIGHPAQSHYHRLSLRKPAGQTDTIAKGEAVIADAKEATSGVLGDLADNARGRE
jgi:hypothetical protein